MPDRADYLARTILSRLRQIEALSTGDDAVAAGRDVRLIRHDSIAKILAVEEGIVDGNVVALVSEAAPDVSASRPASEREQAELAAFLRSRLRL